MIQQKRCDWVRHVGGYMVASLHLEELKMLEGRLKYGTAEETSFPFQS